MLAELLLAVSIGLIVYAFYKWATLNNDYFAKRNLRFRKPAFFFGSSVPLIFGTKTGPEIAQEMYNAFPNDKMYGAFDFRRPMVIVRDPELLKQMAVKDFDHFEDHRSFVDADGDDLFASSLFLMKGQRWRDMRATLSPAFTGSKMRQMFELVTKCADEMTKHFLKMMADGKKIEVDMKDLFSRFSSDVIASCAFGIRINSFENPDNEFYSEATKISSSAKDVFAILRFLFTMALPRLARAMKIQFIPASITTFFTTVVNDTMEERQKRGIFRPDMINTLMQLRQGHLIKDGAEPVGIAQDDSAGFATVEESDIGKTASQRQWTDKELISQAFIFFLAGFETTSTMLTFMAYELCVNPDIQQKLYEEIVEINDNLGGKRITYDTLQKLTYMDQVVSETMRKWPANPPVDRICVKEYLCEYDDNARFLFEKDIGFFVPVYGLHHDPKYYPDPEKFDPERFSDENKQNIVPGTYLPFGIGPRNCIGSRFALMEIKAVIYYILLNFSLAPNAKTQIPVRLMKRGFAMEKGLFLDFIPRQHHHETS